MTTAQLPQMTRPFLTDAGLETDILFNRGIDIPHFASVGLLRAAEGTAALETYFRGFLDLAARHRCGLILESATWRASPDWAEPLGLSLDEQDALNRSAIELLHRLRDEYRGQVGEVIVSGCIGPRGDGYDPGHVMTAEEAQTYHARQAGVMAAVGADMLSAITMTNIPEATGIARCAKALGLPVAISFTVETDGTLPTGDSLTEAITEVDRLTDAYPAYYMVNCAHPSHFAEVLDETSGWTSRVQGVRANASRCSHAELDAMTELDMGNPAELAAEYRELRNRLPQLTVLGGCCGTDLRHVTAIAEACLPA